MRKRFNPWALAITATLTFGSLMAFVGPHSFGHHRGNWSHGHEFYQDHDHNRSGACDGPHNRRLTPKSDSVKIQ